VNDVIQHPKTLRQRDLVLFTVSAILLPDTLAAAASAGASSIAWWLILGIAFLLPFALISAEMGCTYPEQGGIYAWVRDAFGGRWASRITWCYWVNVTVWIPAIFIFGAGMFNQLFQLGGSLLLQISLAVGFVWLAVLVNVITLSVGKWIPNLGAMLKIFLFLGIIVGAIRYVSLNDMANPLTLRTLTPDWGESLQYVPAIVYGMLGFELVSASSAEMRSPERDVPRAIAYSAIIVLAFSLLGTLAVLAAIPVADINLVEGLVDTLRLFFADLPYGGMLVLALGLATIFSIFANGVTWALGGNRAASEAALEGELPAPFAIENPRTGSPVGAAVMLGVISTAILLLYGLVAGTNEELFWSLYACSAVIFLLPYLGMMLAFLRLRKTDGGRHRPFRVPGGNAGARGCAWVCITILAFSIGLFMVAPDAGPQWLVIIGAAVLLGVGEVVIRWAEHQRGTAVKVASESAVVP
jgi:amino acid transporter